jgi:hypothetical protein
MAKTVERVERETLDRVRVDYCPYHHVEARELFS